MPRDFLTLRKVLIYIFLFFVIPGISKLWACTCETDTENVYDKFSRSRAVFTGQVTKVDRSSSEHAVELRVLTTFKGNLRKWVVVHTSGMGTAAAVCGDDFIVGEQYLIYAYGAGSGRETVLSAENGTSVKHFSCAGADLVELNEIKKKFDREIEKFDKKTK